MRTGNGASGRQGEGHALGPAEKHLSLQPLESALERNEFSASWKLKRVLRPLPLCFKDGDIETQRNVLLLKITQEMIKSLSND